MQAEFDSREPLYPDLNIPLNFDAFERNINLTKDAITFCRDLLKLLEADKEIRDRIVVTNGYRSPELVMENTNPWYSNIYIPPSHTTNVINNFHKDEKYDPPKEKAIEKKDDHNSVSTLQTATIGGIVALSLPVAAYVFSEDYNNYQIQERIEKQYQKLLPEVNVREKYLSKRQIQLVRILQNWSLVRDELKSKVQDKTVTKLVTGTGVLTAGISAVLLSGFGVATGLVMVGAVVARKVWNSNVEQDVSDVDHRICDLILDCREFVRENS
jgi:hypothetical protein